MKGCKGPEMTQTKCQLCSDCCRSRAMLERQLWGGWADTRGIP